MAPGDADGDAGNIAARYLDADNGEGREVDWQRVVGTVLAAFAPAIPQFLGIAAFILVTTGPLPGRGPRLFQRRDPWRRFKYGARREVMGRAGGRCEGPVFLAWGRCDEPATEADHIYPWARGGPTLPANGQALCGGHNRHKGSMRPPWWYVVSLERRRRTYFPADADVRVSAVLSSAELESHAATPGRAGSNSRQADG